MPSVLIVDDDEDLRDLFRHALRLDGHHIATAVDGHEAWQLLGASSFDVLVVDVVMPRVDGLELVSRCRCDDRHSACHIILVSARAFPDDVASGIAAGADEYLVKPVSPRVLRGVVRDLVAS